MKIIKVFLVSTIFLVIASLLSGCNKKYPPEVETKDAGNITTESAVCNGVIFDDGGEDIISRGFKFGRSDPPSENDYVSGEGEGGFQHVVTGLSPVTTYYVQAYAINSEGQGLGEVISFTTLGKAPSATLQDLTDLTTSSVKLNFQVVPNHLTTSIIIEWGPDNDFGNIVVPEVSPVSGESAISLSIVLNDLEPGTKYFARITVENTLGTYSSNIIDFKTFDAMDIDGNAYYSVSIGDQTWLSENLKTSRFSNGDLIETGKLSDSDMTDKVNPIYQWPAYDNSKNGPQYGRYYTGYVASDSRNVCPAGWHVPTVNEWDILIQYLADNGYGFEGSGDDIAKALASTSGWTEWGEAGTIGSNSASNNSSGFTALAAGFRYSDGAWCCESTHTKFWSSNPETEVLSQAIGLGFNVDVVSKQDLSKLFGFSIRCVKD